MCEKARGPQNTAPTRRETERECVQGTETLRDRDKGEWVGTGDIYIYTSFKRRDTDTDTDIDIVQGEADGETNGAE